jgi:multidrug efflux pump subunit AcrA (membrane-fusion protein)
MRRQYAIAAVVLVVLVGAVVVFARPFQRQPAVETATVTRGSVESTIELAGSIVPRETRVLTFAAGGTVTSVATGVGEVVAPGQVLAAVDDTAAQAQLRAAQLAIDAANARLASDTGGLTPAQLAQAKDPVTQAQQALSAAKSAEASARSQRGASVAAARSVLDAAQTRLDDDTASGAAEAILALDQLAVRAAQANLDAVTAQADAAVAQAAAGVKSAQSALTTAQHGYEVRTAAAPDALIAADEAAIASAEASLAAANQAVAATTLTSPITGTVTEVGIRVGDRTGGLGGASGLGALGGTTDAGSGRIVVADLTALRVSATASEIDVVSLAGGQAATITLDALPDLTLDATICELGDSGSSASGVVEYPVTLCLDGGDARLRTGMSANVSIVLARRDNVLLVPTPAITTTGGRTTARILRDDGSIATVDVVVGVSSGTRIEVISGLTEGDRVVVGGSTG